MNSLPPLYLRHVSILSSTLLLHATDPFISLLVWSLQNKVPTLGCLLFLYLSASGAPGQAWVNPTGLGAPGAWETKDWEDAWGGEMPVWPRGIREGVYR